MIALLLGIGGMSGIEVTLVAQDGLGHFVLIPMFAVPVLVLYFAISIANSLRSIGTSLEVISRKLDTR